LLVVEGEPAGEVFGEQQRGGELVLAERLADPVLGQASSWGVGQPLGCSVCHRIRTAVRMAAMGTPRNRAAPLRYRSQYCRVRAAASSRCWSRSVSWSTCAVVMAVEQGRQGPG
jgi:hypothetical protein